MSQELSLKQDHIKIKVYKAFVIRLMVIGEIFTQYNFLKQIICISIISKYHYQQQILLYIKKRGLISSILASLHWLSGKSNRIYKPSSNI